MARRWLRALTIVLPAAAVCAFGMPAASADPLLGQCVVVSNPTSTNHTVCSGDDLGQVTTGGLDLSYAELDHTTAAAGSVSDSSTFVDANLTDANWAGFGLDGSNFQGAVLDGIDLINGRERGVDFTGAHITDADLSDGIFAAEAGFGPAKFTNANLSGTDFIGSTFSSGTDLDDFTGATLSGATFDGTNLVPADQTTTATSSSGADVSWPAPQAETGEQLGTCHDASGPVASGDVFPIGATTVSCAVVDVANGTSGTGSFTVRVTGTPPAITSADATTFTVGLTGTFTVESTGTPTATITRTGALPPGIVATAQDGTLVLSGTPAAGSGGRYPLTFTATNGVAPDATQSFTLTVDQAPAFTSADATTFTVDQPGSFTVTADGYPASSINETGPLPGGVSFTNGVLAGTPHSGSQGVYPLTFTATNGVAPDATQSFTLTVDESPTITSADATTFTVGTAGTFTVVATGSPAPSIAESGALPAGVSFADGVLVGTPAAGTGGTYAITFTASNAAGTATQSFTLTVDEGPAITSADSTTFVVGTTGIFTVTATGSPAPSITETGALPSGVSFANGVLSGTPAAGTGGTYPIAFTASNSAGTATQTFTLTVDEAPAITSADSTTFTVGTAGTFTVTATGSPAPSITETGALPGGVTFANGVLSGTAAAGTGGTYPITFTASNSAGTATQTFTLTVDEAPAITSADSTTFTVGTAGTFTVTASGSPAPSITETGALPSGVTFANGVLSGIPARGTGGQYTLTLTASNGVSPDATQSFTLTVDELPTITSPDTATFVTGQRNTFTVTTTGFPASITETGALPPGVTLTDNHDGTATLAGVPTVTGSFPITVTDTNATGTATQHLTLVVIAPLAVTGTLPGGTVGVAYHARLTATGGTVPYTWSVTAGRLPAGLDLRTDGTVSGTPTRAGTYHVTVQVNDPATKAMTIHIAAAPPTTPSPTPSTPATSPASNSTTPPAATGADVVATVDIAIAMLLIGSGLVLASRRRRQPGRHFAG